MSDSQDRELRQLSDLAHEVLAKGVAPQELPMAQRERLRSRVLLEACDPSPEGTVTVRAQQAVWVEVAPLIQMKLLGRHPVGGSQTALIRMLPGACVPAHRHSENEEFTVLEGECSIGSHQLRAGDVHIAAAGSWHEDTTTRTGVLVLLRGEYPHDAVPMAGIQK